MRFFFEKFDLKIQNCKKKANCNGVRPIKSGCSTSAPCLSNKLTMSEDPWTNLEKIFKNGNKWFFQNIFQYIIILELIYRLHDVDIFAKKYIDTSYIKQTETWPICNDDTKIIFIKNYLMHKTIKNYYFLNLQFQEYLSKF